MGTPLTATATDLTATHPRTLPMTPTTPAATLTHQTPATPTTAATHTAHPATELAHSQLAEEPSEASTTPDTTETEATHPQDTMSGEQSIIDLVVSDFVQE